MSSLSDKRQSGGGSRSVAMYRARLQARKPATKAHLRQLAPALHSPPRRCVEEPEAMRVQRHDLAPSGAVRFCSTGAHA
jgi:hypothetical protein